MHSRNLVLLINLSRKLMGKLLFCDSSVLILSFIQPRRPSFPVLRCLDLKVSARPARGDRDGDPLGLQVPHQPLHARQHDAVHEQLEEGRIIKKSSPKMSSEISDRCISTDL